MCFRKSEVGFSPPTEHAIQSESLTQGGMMPYVHVRGVNLYYEDRGQGPPLLLVPGALGTAWSDFGPQLDALPNSGLRVVAPDPRGYGKSRPPAREFPLDLYEQDVQDCAALMETIGCDSYTVGGWSDGAI